MCKRVMIGLFAMSVVAMWWTEADAATCKQWGYSGGSRVCTRWSTKGVMVGVDIIDGYDCGPKGKACKVTANAEANKNIVSCKNNVTGNIRRMTVTLPVPLIFSGSADGCDPGNDGSDTVCNATIVLQAACPAVCTTGKETCIDATPLDMKTSVEACIGIEELKDCIEQTPPACSEKSPICTIKGFCRIDPNKIAFNRVRPFNCE